jgi:hypothetical protein
LTSSSAEVKERVELYLYSFFCPHGLFYRKLYVITAVSVKITVFRVQCCVVQYIGTDISKHICVCCQSFYVNMEASFFLRDVGHIPESRLCS